MRNILHAILFVASIFLFCSCNTDKREYFTIGISLCNDDMWHQTVISELQHEAQFYTDIQLELRSNKNGEDVEQIKTINSFIAERKDLIVVSAGNASQITPVVQKAYQAKIPVIILDQRIETDSYTAYVGGDNYRIGREVALYIVNILEGKGNVVEIRGRTESLTDIERHHGFINGIANYPDIKIINTEQADFNTALAEKKMTEIIRTNKSIDVVFAMDDLTAKGVYNAYQKAGIDQPFTIGVDALAGEGGGMDNIIKGYQDISFIYPTGAEKVLEVAHSILTGKSFEKENILYTGIIDRSNVELMLKQKEHLHTEQRKTGQINTELTHTQNKYLTQRILLYSSIFIILLIAVVLLVVIKAYHSKKKSTVKLQEKYRTIEEEHARVILQNKDIQKQIDILSQPEGFAEGLSEDQKYIAKVRDCIMDHIANSSLDVETIAQLLGESYTQMYRKIKSTTGYSPVEFIRIIRLTYAKQLLSTKTKNISEVAYEAGFSSPSYFTRCFKKFYNESPKEYLSKSTVNS